MVVAVTASRDPLETLIGRWIADVAFARTIGVRFAAWNVSQSHTRVAPEIANFALAALVVRGAATRPLDAYVVNRITDLAFARAIQVRSATAGYRRVVARAVIQTNVLGTFDAVVAFVIVRAKERTVAEQKRTRRELRDWR